MAFLEEKSKILNNQSIEIYGSLEYYELFLFDKDETSTDFSKFDLAFFLKQNFKDHLDILIFEDDYYFLVTEKNIQFLNNINENQHFKNKFSEIYNLEIETILFFKLNTSKFRDNLVFKKFELFINFKNDFFDIDALNNKANSILSKVKEKIDSFNIGENSSYFAFKKLKGKDYIHDLLNRKTFGDIVIPYSFFEAIKNHLMIKNTGFNITKKLHHSGSFVEIRLVLFNTFNKD